MIRLFSILLVAMIVPLMLAAQPGVIQIAKNYYRTSPYDSEFSQFLQQLINDPSVANKVIRKKTDSTLFYFEGEYANHKRFFFKPVRTRVILGEKEDVVVQDSATYVNTIYQYQIIGYAPPGEEGLKDIKAEFDKFERRFKRGFSQQEAQELGSPKSQTGSILNFSFTNLRFHAVTAAWVTSADKSENMFAITIRFQVSNNYAFLPLLLGN